MSDRKRLHLGAGKSPKAGWVNLDQCDLPGIDVVADLGRCRDTRLPFEDDTFDEMYGSHVIEHILDTLPLMQELHRIAKKDCMLTFRLPYGSSDDAWENPTHVRPYFLHSFGYFSQPFYWREDYGYRGDWQVVELNLAVRKGLYHKGIAASEIMEDVIHKRNIVTEMSVTMVAVKPIRPCDRNLQEAPVPGIVLI